MNKPLLKSKTTWAGIGGIIAAAAGFFTGEIELGSAIQMALTAVIGVFLRDGMRSKDGT